MRATRQPLKVDIEFYRAKREIILALSPSEEGQELNEKNLRTAIASENFGDYYLYLEQLEKILALEELTTQQLFNIAERRDCVISIDVSPDSMQAHLSIQRAYGGASPSPSLLNLKLNELQIKQGILHENIEEVIWQGEAQSLLIASGEPPIHQLATQFEYIGPLQASGKPQIMEDGRVDFAQLDTISSVEAGTALMRRIISPPGKNGVNILGEIIPFESHKERAFGVGKGVHIDSADPNLMIASIAGQPKPRPTCVNIESLLDLKAIDQTTGNVKFDGTVRVERQISGYEVEVGGDLIVNGPVEAYIIHVGGDTLLKSGIKGHNRGFISCSGKLTTKYIESCSVEANLDLHVLESSINSHVSSLSSIYVGQEGGRGQIIGGKINAQTSITTNIVGSNAEVYTILEVGSNPRLNKKLVEKYTEQDQVKLQFDELIKNIIYLKMRKSEPEQIKKLEAQREELLLKINLLKEEIQFLNDKVSQSNNNEAYIRITNKIHPGTVLIISGISRVFRETTLGGKYVLQNGEVRSLA